MFLNNEEKPLPGGIAGRALLPQIDEWGNRSRIKRNEEFFMSLPEHDMHLGDVLLPYQKKWLGGQIARQGD